MNRYLRMGLKAQRVVELIEQRVGGTAGTTDKGGVPYLTVDDVRIVYSLSRQCLQVFSNTEQTTDYEHWSDVVQHVLERRPRLSHDQLVALYKQGHNEILAAELKRHRLIKEGESVSDVIRKLAEGRIPPSDEAATSF